MPKTEQLLHRIDELERETGVRRTIFAACPNSPAVISASIRAAKRNNAPIYFAATLNQIDCDGGYTGMTQAEFTRMIRFEVERVHFTGPVIVAIDHGGPWLKDKQRTEKWSVKDAMDGVKKSFEAAVLAGYDLIHVDPTVDINVPKGETIDIRLVAARTVELIAHVENFRKKNGLPAISYEVGTEEVHGGLADEKTFDTFIQELKKGLVNVGLPDVWPCFIVGKVGTDLDTTVFDPVVARSLTSKVRPLGSYIKGHYTDDVANPEEYPLCGMGAANVGPEFTISEYRALCELEELEVKYEAEGRVAVPHEGRAPQGRPRIPPLGEVAPRRRAGQGPLRAHRGPSGLDRRHLLPLHLAAARSPRRPRLPVCQSAAPGHRSGADRPRTHRAGYGQVFPRIQSYWIE